MLNGPSESEKPATKLICFDFDQTITVSHAYQYLAKNSKYQPTEETMQDCFRKCGLLNRSLTRATIETAITNGHLVAITSYTVYPDYITFTLKKLGLSDDIISKIKIIPGFPIDENSLTMKPISKPYDEVGKRLHIREAIKWANEQGFKIENENIILIDDSEKNIEVAEKDGHRGILVPHRTREAESKLTNEELRLYRDRITKERQTYLFQLQDYIGKFSDIHIEAYESELAVLKHNNDLLNRLGRFYNEHSDDFQYRVIEDVVFQMSQEFCSTFVPMNDRIKDQLVGAMYENKEVTSQALDVMAKMDLPDLSLKPITPY